ncbi:acetoacetyl-coenzyme A synthetase [Thozetella sp. PMI_491]|nr:acetoacetyl-coenzyme A synthetase [Thozetella sp. PMI_491]
MSSSLLPRKLWEHPDPKSTNMDRFRRALEKETGKPLKSFHDLHEFSTTHATIFWQFLAKYSRLVAEGDYDPVIDESARMDSIPIWFSGLRLNFAENVLFSQDGKLGKEDDNIAVSVANETGPENIKHFTWGELRERTARLAQALKAHGVQKGDRVAAISGNNLNTMLVFLATTALGGVFSSSSTEMGVSGILERLRQIKPRWVFMDDGTNYNGKSVDLREKIRGVGKGMALVDGFESIVSMPHDESKPRDISAAPKTQSLSQFLSSAREDDLEFVRVAFGDPCLIVYSSGTTGTPKCIVHSAGGMLLNGYKEGALHQELGTSSVALQYTTTSWIMYLAVVQTLVFGSRVVLYDGSPFLPQRSSFMKLAAQERVSHLGISPRYLHELRVSKILPREVFDLSSLEVVNSTGMVLPDNLFEWFYDHGFPKHVRLNNMSGGTDLAGCFGIGNSISPVYVGGCSGLSLGVRVEVYDTGIEGGKGSPVKDGTAGELVASAPFPNMPVAFWGPDGPKKYHDAYFARFDDVWVHGDFVMIHPATRQLFFLGRSDGVLNPSGVRFGSAEIYRIVESHFAAEVVDSLCVGQKRPKDSYERVFLFLLLRPRVTFTNDLAGRIKAVIRKELSPRHVPAFIFPTPEIPTTVNMKKVELPVKHIISGMSLKPSGTLLNPESLKFYAKFANVEELEQEKSKL